MSQILKYPRLLILRKKNKIIGVPISAIVIKSDTSSTKKSAIIETISASEEKFECVFVKDGDKAKLRVVTTGIQDDSNIEISSGLSEGEVVITGPYNTVTKSLKSGDLVEVKAPKEEKNDSEN